jgi:hypothetical protein
MAREELKWQNIDADDLPAEVKKSFDAMVDAEATLFALEDKAHDRLFGASLQSRQSSKANATRILS